MAEPYVSFVHPDDVEATLERTAALAEQGSTSVIAFENRYRTRDGDYRDLEWTTVADDGVLYFVTKDLTDRRATEAEEEQAELLIRQSEKLHRSLTANLPDTSRVPARSRPADPRRRGRGDQAPSLVRRGPVPGPQGDGAVRRGSRRRASALDRSYRAVLAGERRSFEFVSAGLTIAVQAVPIRADDGTVESALVVVRDVSERTNSEELIVRRAQQQKAVAELGRFALESHDLSELMAEAAATARARSVSTGPPSSSSASLARPWPSWPGSTSARATPARRFRSARPRTPDTPCASVSR